MKGFECDFCGKETDGCYVDSGRNYCNPEHATKAFEKRIERFLKNVSRAYDSSAI